MAYLLSHPVSGNLRDDNDFSRDLGFVEIPAGTKLHLTIAQSLEAHWYNAEQYWAFLVDVGQEQPIEVIPVGLNPDGSATYEPTVAIELSAAT